MDNNQLDSAALNADSAIQVLNGPDTNSPGDLLTRLCTAAAANSLTQAKAIAASLTGTGVQGVLSDLAFDLADGVKPIVSITDSIFSIGIEPLGESAKNSVMLAQSLVADLLNLPAPTLAIEVCPAGTPTHAVGGLNGFGLIAASEAALSNVSLMVHEVTHCAIMSRALFLDEGLATALEMRAGNRQVQPHKWNRPSLAALIEADWTEDPYFDALATTAAATAPKTAAAAPVYHLAAYLVERMLEKNSPPLLAEKFTTLKAQIREGRSAEVINQLFSIDLWEIDRELAPADPDPAIVGKLAEAAGKALAEGDKNAAQQLLPEARAACGHAAGAVALTKILIVLCADTGNPLTGPLYRTEALVAMQRARSLQADAETMDFLDAYKPLIKLYGLGNAIEKRAASVKSLATFHRLLQRSPEQPEVIIAAAKAQTYADHDFLPNAIWREKLAEVGLHPVFSAAAEKLINHIRFSR